MASLVRLHPYPLAHGAPEITVEAALAREADQLMLRYLLRGKVGALLVPAPASAQRRDELWRHTCAELFVATPEQAGYVEFNFSPSGEWAAYQFDGYRVGARPLQCASPDISVQHDANVLRMTVQCHLPASLAEMASLQLGITMAIEDEEHDISYWALKHPCDKPDFHHRDGFILTLGA